LMTAVSNPNNNPPKAAILASALDTAISNYLENSKSPSRKVNEIDNRASTFYLAMYWAQALAEQGDDADLKSEFESIAKQMSDNEDTITKEMLDAQGESVEIGGYFLPDEKMTEDQMRPSTTFNSIIDSI